MLERAASSLELCAARRILCRPTRHAYSCPTPQAAFWQHGAAALELSAAWAALQRARAPTGRGPILRSKRLLTRYDAVESLYLSNTIPPSVARRSPFSLDLQHSFPSPIRARPITTSALRRLPTAPRGTSTYLPRNGQSSALSRINASAPRRHLSSSEPEGSNSSRPGLEILSLIDTSQGNECVERVCELWKSVPSEEKPSLRLNVVRYLRRVSRGEDDVRRCWDLLSELPPALLKDHLILDAVWCAAKLGMHTRAVEFLRLSLDSDRTANRHQEDPQNALSMGIFKEILTSSFETASWPLLWDACRTWCMGVFSHEHPKPDFLNSLAGSEKATPKFWQHLKDQENAAEKDGVLVGEPSAAHAKLSSDGSSSNAILHAEAASEANPGLESVQRPLEATPPTAEFDSAPKQDLDGTFAFTTRLLLTVARQVLLRPCKPPVAIAFLRTMRYPEHYTLYFQQMVSAGTTHNLPMLFDDRRSLPALEMDPQILRIMFNVYHPLNPNGLLEVHRLFCRLHYEGSQGSPRDPAELRDWWRNYAIRGVLSNYARDPLVFLPYVEESKYRGDSNTEQFAMELVKRKLRFEDRDLPWFAELKRYAERLDYEGAMEVWHPRFKGDKPDKVTLVTLMRVASERGDVAFTTGLFDKARLWGLDRTPEVLIPVIRAFGMHRSPEEASKICTWAIDNGAATTQVFNAMLEVYADLNRLHELRGLMKVMAEHSIPWDDQTYMHLMKSLGRTKRGFDAHGLLNKASDLGIQGLTLEHFETSMAGAVKMGIYRLAYVSARRMKREGLPISLGATSLLVKAAHRWKQSEAEHSVSPGMEKELLTGKDLVELYRKTAQSDTETMQRGGEPGLSRDRLTIKRVAFTLAEVGDRESLYEFASVYFDAMQREYSERHLPSGVITALMVLHFEHLGEYERVKDLWRILWDRHYQTPQQRMAGVEASYRTAPKVHPKSQYALDEGFRVMQQVLARERNADGLLQLIYDITSQGYLLGQRNWNHAIQALVTMGKWKEAFKFNEQMLMPNWTGWRHFRRFKNLRRRRQAWDAHDALREEQESTQGDKVLPEDDPSLSPEERQYQKDHRLVGDFLRHMYNIRKIQRMQAMRKLKGTSITLAPWIRDPGRNPRYLRPNAHTLYKLAKAYFEMEETNAWVGKSQEWIDMFCPVSGLAVGTLRYVDEVTDGRRGAPEELDDDRADAEALEGSEEWGGADEGGEGPEGAVSEEKLSTRQQLRRWREESLPPSLRAAITDVLARAPKRRQARQEEVMQRKKERRKELAALQQEEIKKRSWEELEAEAREKERAEWMRKAGVVDFEEVKEDLLTTDNFFGDDAGEKDEKDVESEGGEDEEEEEIESFERDPRQRKHKARRGKKLR